MTYTMTILTSKIKAIMVKEVKMKRALKNIKLMEIHNQIFP